MKVVQCWDDGLVSDIRLSEMLRKYDAKATFNISTGLNKESRQVLWCYKGVDVIALAKHELVSVFDGFDIASHSLSHPNLTELPEDQVRYQITENKKQLEVIFNRKIKGFCYPFGGADSKVAKIVEQCGHTYARTTERKNSVKFGDEKFLAKPSCHFLDEDFWQLYEQSKEQGVFYFWGHSYEIATEEMWEELEDKIKRITLDAESQWDSVFNVF
ncbi:polysaccharide deacetylase family protein [Vibrio parahaemolyticus]|uniref:polysaccharide deacetylase family protein n=1 Tax=Vibrio parahaemolyticus TaxID=670 RepID=UPI0015DED74C|nr:polysaccharide deacetylase family protein [Vibrio parahaemolyticus]HCM1552928.1 polysaccharide deacetylase family protein [Vibrio parahaemolyticus]